MKMTLTTLTTAALLTAGTTTQAAVIFSDDFESPDVTAGQSDGNTSGAIDSTKWQRNTQGFGSNRQGTVDESHGDFTDPVGEQAYAFRYTNSGITTKDGLIGALTSGETYTVSFDVVLDGHNSTTPYSAALVTFNGGLRDRMNGGGIAQNTTAVLATATGNSTGDGLYTTVTFSYTADGTEATLGQDVALRFAGATSSAIIDNVSIDVVPEPGSLALLGLGGLLIGVRRRK